MSNVICHECGKYYYGDMSVIRPCRGKEVINVNKASHEASELPALMTLSQWPGSFEARLGTTSLFVSSEAYQAGWNPACFFSETGAVTP